MFKLKFKVLFKSGIKKSYKSKSFSSYKQCKSNKEEYISFFKVCFRDDKDGQLNIGNNIIRTSDVSAVTIKITI